MVTKPAQRSRLLVAWLHYGIQTSRGFFATETGRLHAPGERRPRARVVPYNVDAKLVRPYLDLSGLRTEDDVVGFVGRFGNPLGPEVGHARTVLKKAATLRVALSLTAAVRYSSKHWDAKARGRLVTALQDAGERVDNPNTVPLKELREHALDAFRQIFAAATRSAEFRVVVFSQRGAISDALTPLPGGYVLGYSIRNLFDWAWIRLAEDLHAGLEPRLCPCGAVFVDRRSQAVYCSPSCQTTFKSRRARLRQANNLKAI